MVNHEHGAMPHSMSGPNKITALGARLKTERRKQRLSLRDLADETGISLNTLSRVERGHMPDLRNYQKIVDWLGVPADTFLDFDIDQGPLNTPEIIARHLRSDTRLGRTDTAKIVAVIQQMYQKLAAERPALAVHMRSAKSFTPEAGTLLASILAEMQQKLLAEPDR